MALVALIGKLCSKKNWNIEYPVLNLEPKIFSRPTLALGAAEWYHRQPEDNERSAGFQSIDDTDTEIGAPLTPGGVAAAHETALMTKQELNAPEPIQLVWADLMAKRRQTDPDVFVECEHMSSVMSVGRR